MKIGEEDDNVCRERGGKVLSFAAYREALRRLERLRSLSPYCGKCLDKTGEINDLIPHLVRLEGGLKATGYWCASCGEEF